MCEKMRLQKSPCWTINFILEEKEDENEEEGEYRMMILLNNEMYYLQHIDIVVSDLHQAEVVWYLASSCKFRHYHRPKTLNIESSCLKQKKGN